MDNQDVVMAEPQAGYNPELRNRELTKIFEWTSFLYERFAKTKIELGNDLDLDLGNDLSGAFHTIYHNLRKMANNDNRSRGNLYGDKTVKIGQEEVSINGLIEEFAVRNPDFTFDFKMATPLVDTLTSFKCMWDEVRLSCAQFKLRVKGNIRNMNIKDLGLDNAAIPRLRGITWKPERRSGMIKTMGPLTLAILLAAETTYKNKLMVALENSISILPMAKYIVKCLADMDAPETASGILSLLNSILMLIGNRSAHKMHFPLLFFAKSFAKHKAETLSLNFSGKEGFIFYERMAPRFNWIKKSQGPPEKIAQVVFHSIFGTSLEDLGLLSQITTTVVWHQRRMMNIVFEKAATQAPKTFTPVRFKFVSKLAAANIVKNTGTITPQLDPDYVFSGARKRTFSEAFMGFVEKGHRGGSYSDEPGALAYAMKHYKDALVADAKQGGLTELGTTQWLSVAGAEMTPSNNVFSGTGEFFYS